MISHSYLLDISEYIKSNETLQSLYNEGTINSDDVIKIMNKDIEKLRLQVQKVHPYKWNLSNGKWQTYVKDDTRTDHRRRIKANTEIELLDRLIEHYQNASNIASKHSTLESLYPLWLDYKKLHTEASSYIIRINSDWNTYYKNTDIVKVPICDLSKLMLDTWVHKLIKDNHMTKNKYYNTTVIIRQMLDFAVDSGIISSNLFRDVKVDGKRLFKKMVKKESSTQVFLKDEEQKVIEYAWNDFHNETKDYVLSPLAVLFMFETGIRISEACVLRYEDIIDSNHINIQRMLRRDSKEVVDHPKGTYGNRVTILTHEANKIIQTARDYQIKNHLQSDGYIFSTDNRPCSYHAISSLYTKYSHMMGIQTKSSHKARKTYISALIDSGFNINSLREMVGHADERTTYNNYCFDRATEDERVLLVEKALK